MIEISHTKGKTIFVGAASLKPQKEKGKGKGKEKEKEKADKEKEREKEKDMQKSDMDAEKVREEEIFTDIEEGEEDEVEQQLIAVKASTLLLRPLNEKAVTLAEEAEKEKRSKEEKHRKRLAQLQREQSVLLYLWMFWLRTACALPYYEFLSFSFSFASLMGKFDGTVAISQPPSFACSLYVLDSLALSVRTFTCLYVWCVGVQAVLWMTVCGWELSFSATFSVCFPCYSSFSIIHSQELH